MLSRFFRMIAASFLLLAGGNASALEPMLGADLTWTRIQIAGESFNPLAARVHLGLGFRNDWEIGVVGGSGVVDDTSVSVTANIGSMYAGYLRYGAPLDDNARLSLAVGYGSMSVDVKSPLPGFPGAQDYSGLMYGISLEERLARFPRWTGSLDFERWYDDKGLRIGAISYGFRYGF